MLRGCGRLPAIVGLLLFVAALEVRIDLARSRGTSSRATSNTPPRKPIEALFFTFANYAVLTGPTFWPCRISGSRWRPASWR